MARFEIHRSDGNCAEIVRALRKAGASVELIDRPVDVLAGFRGANYLMEIKTTRGKLRTSQRAFMDGWRGVVSVVRSVDEALKVIGVLK